MTTIADNSEKSTNGDTENVFERKAREIINWTVSEGTRDFSALLAAIAAALEAERLEEREEIVELLTHRAEHHRTEIDLSIGETAKTVRDMLQAELFELAAAIRNRST